MVVARRALSKARAPGRNLSTNCSVSKVSGKVDLDTPESGQCQDKFVILGDGLSAVLLEARCPIPSPVEPRQAQ